MTEELVRYSADGEAFSYDFDAHDSPDSEIVGYDRGWGLQFEDKDALSGMTLTFVGMRPAADFGQGDTVAVRFRFDGDPYDTEPWGVLFSITSPVVQQLVAQWKRNAHARIRAKLVKQASSSNKGQSYWTLQAPDPLLVADDATPATKGKRSN